MSIRILGGNAKGFTLSTPDSDQTKPTSVMLRRKLFDANQDLTDWLFIDLCAGTGSMGLEALSRGAKTSVFIEPSLSSYKILKKNLQNFQKKYPDLGKIDSYKMDFQKWLSIHHSTLKKEKNVLFFFDPPYEKLDLYEKFFSILKKFDLKGRVVVEACEQKTMRIEQFELKYGEGRKYRQGTSYFIIYDF